MYNLEKGTVLTQDTQALCLENFLKWRKVNDQQLPHYRSKDSVAEHFVTAKSNLKHRFGLLNKQHITLYR